MSTSATQASASKCLKPILKGKSASPCPLQAQKHAHFPPPELEARRFSGIDYDRSPIVVGEDSVQNMLPRRGCPGRTFYETVVQRHHQKHQLDAVVAPTSGDQSITRKLSKNTDTFDFSVFSVPPLPIYETSESSDSEGITSPPSEDETVTSYKVPLEIHPHIDECALKQRKRLRRNSNGERKPSRHAGKTLIPPSEFSSFSHSDSCLGGF
jgi:hypothetical protein